jgi:hypothetical protein
LGTGFRGDGGGFGPILLQHPQEIVGEGIGTQRAEGQAQVGVLKTTADGCLLKLLPKIVTLLQEIFICVIITA